MWKETHYIILYASQLAQVANKSDVFSLEVLDWNNMKKDKCMGVTRSLALSRWLMLLEGGKEVKEELMEKKNKEVEEGGDGAEDATNHHPGKTTCAADDTASPSSPSETTTHLTPDEKDALIAEWGHPSGGPDIWKKLYTDDDYKKLAGGDIRLNMLYFKVPEVARTVATLEDLMDAPTGILKIKVHQAKDLPSKSANAFVVMELGNGKEVARTPIRKRTK